MAKPTKDDEDRASLALKKALDASTTLAELKNGIHDVDEGTSAAHNAAHMLNFLQYRDIRSAEFDRFPSIGMQLRDALQRLLIANERGDGDESETDELRTLLAGLAGLPESRM